MSASGVTVRTLLLANFYEPGAELATQRRNMTTPQAMKRVELADQALEKELNAFSEKGYRIISAFTHPSDEHPQDLIITVIFERPDQA